VSFIYDKIVKDLHPKHTILQNMVCRFWDKNENKVGLGRKSVKKIL